MKDIIEKYNIKAKKSLGQNFLMDEDVLNWISEITHINWENILEVWPWFWALTWKILEKNPQSLTLVELDNFMVDILNDRIAHHDLDISTTEFKIINSDILKTEVLFNNYKVIANIPYYITSPILFRFLYDVNNKPNEMIILMQKEVWDRITSIKSSVLSLFVQKKCKVSQKIFVPRKCFSPSPKIDSCVLFFETHTIYNHIDDNVFLSFIKSSFSSPRKKVINNLWNGWYNKSEILLKLQNLWFTENTRAEELTIENYIYLLLKE